MAHFLNPRVGAVTGNPRVRNRSTLLGRLQVGEFSSIVGLIKRAQRTYGRIFTVSGVVACFRKAALHDVGYWSTDMLTEDIDISWKLQIRHWDVRFEPKAHCWILAPETLRGLWQQRLRWATGGIQVVIKYWQSAPSGNAARMWPLLEYVFSVIWAYAMVMMALLWLAGLVIELPPGYRVPSLLAGWSGVMVATTCLIQIGVSLALDARYDKGSLNSFYWMIWYPLAYWMLNMFTTIVAVPRALLRDRRRGRDGPVRTAAYCPLKSPLVDAPICSRRGRGRCMARSTLAFWGFWFYLWLPITCAARVDAGPARPQIHGRARGYHDAIRLLGIYGPVVVLLGVRADLMGVTTLSLWRRRETHFRPPGHAVEIGRDFGQSPASVARWQSEQRLYVTHDQEGRIARVEILVRRRPGPDLA